MADVNSWAFTGRLGADAQIKSTPNGKTYMEMSAAVTIGYGQYKKTLWVKVKQWGDRTKDLAGMFTKGALIGGAGELSTNTWTDKDGKERTDLEVTCNSIQILSSKKKEEGEQGSSEPESDPVF